MSVIAVVEPKWWGHHPTYTKRIVHALMDQGHQVLVLCAEPHEVAAYLEQTEVENRLTHVWFKELNYQELVQRPLLVLRKGNQRYKDRFWKRTADALQSLIFQTGLTPDITFFCMIDDYINAPVSASDVAKLFPYPWSGLVVFPHWLHGSPGHIPPCLMDEHCKGLFLLDETLVELAHELLDKPCQVFPDVTDITEPPEGFQTELLTTIREFQEGRQLVGLFGVVDQRKGIFHLLRIAKILKDKPIAFVIAGEASGKKAERDVDNFEKEVLASGLTNVLFKRGQIAEGMDFNTLISAVDLLWAAYPHFAYSSNQLTKAAYFGTPVAVNIGGLLAERVRKFNLGIVLPTVNTKRSARVISSFLLENKEHKANRSFREYYALHSSKGLDQAVRNIPLMSQN